MKTNHKKSPPKLPRFQCPKDMRSKVFKNKKEKASSRAALSLELKKTIRKECSHEA